MIKVRLLSGNESAKVSVETESKPTTPSISSEIVTIPGLDGTTFTPSVSQEGIISWTNDGGKVNPQPVNIKGMKGDKGDPGEPEYDEENECLRFG